MACVILSHCEVNVTRAILLCNDVSVFIIRKAQTYANYITSKKPVLNIVITPYNRVMMYILQNGYTH